MPFRLEINYPKRRENQSVFPFHPEKIKLKIFRDFFVVRKTMKNKVLPRAKSAFYIIAVSFVLSFSFAAAAKPLEKFAGKYPAAFSASSFGETELDIFDLVNEQRRRSGLNELEWDGELARLARDYSRKMAREDFFDHHDPEGATVVERARNARVKNWSKIGENLFFCEGADEFSRLAVRGWMKSPTHKENILDRDWNRSGIGVFAAPDNRIYVTQVFIERKINE